MTNEVDARDEKKRGRGKKRRKKERGGKGRKGKERGKSTEKKKGTSEFGCEQVAQ